MSPLAYLYWVFIMEEYRDPTNTNEIKIIKQSNSSLPDIFNNQNRIDNDMLLEFDKNETNRANNLNNLKLFLPDFIK